MDWDIKSGGQVPADPGIPEEDQANKQFLKDYAQEGQANTSIVGPAPQTAYRSPVPQAPVGPGHAYEVAGGRPVVDRLFSTYDQMAETATKLGDIEARKADEEYPELKRQEWEARVAHAQTQREIAERDQYAKQQLINLNQEASRLAQAKLDSGRVFRNPAGFMAGLSLAMMPFFSKNPEDGNKAIDNFIQQDLDNQKAELAHKRGMVSERRGLLSDYVQLTKDYQTGRMLAEAKMKELAAQRIMVIGAKYRSEEARTRAAMTAQSLMHDKAALETQVYSKLWREAQPMPKMLADRYGADFWSRDRRTQPQATPPQQAPATVPQSGVAPEELMRQAAAMDASMRAGLQAGPAVNPQRQPQPQIQRPDISIPTIEVGPPEASDIMPTGKSSQSMPQFLRGTPGTRSVQLPATANQMAPIAIPEQVYEPATRERGLQAAEPVEKIRRSQEPIVIPEQIIPFDEAELNQSRISRGLSPLPTEAQLKSGKPPIIAGVYEDVASLDEVNKNRAKKGLPPLRGGSAFGPLPPAMDALVKLDTRPLAGSELAKAGYADSYIEIRQQMLPQIYFEKEKEIAAKNPYMSRKDVEAKATDETWKVWRDRNEKARGEGQAKIAKEMTPITARIEQLARIQTHMGALEAELGPDVRKFTSIWNELGKGEAAQKIRQFGKAQGWTDEKTDAVTSFYQRVAAINLLHGKEVSGVAISPTEMGRLQEAFSSSMPFTSIKQTIGDMSGETEALRRTALKAGGDPLASVYWMASNRTQHASLPHKGVPSSGEPMPPKPQPGKSLYEHWKEGNKMSPVYQGGSELYKSGSELYKKLFE